MLSWLKAKENLSAIDAQLTIVSGALLGEIAFFKQRLVQLNIASGALV